MALGVKTTGDLAKLVMLPWDKKFVEKLPRLEIVRKLYKRYIHYIDYQNIVVEEFGPGSSYNINKEEEKIEIVEESVESDMEVRGDKRTFEIVRGGGQPGGDDKIDSRLPIKSPWLPLAHFHVQIGVLLPLLLVLASPIAAVQINVSLPSLLP